MLSYKDCCYLESDDALMMVKTEGEHSITAQPGAPATLASDWLLICEHCHSASVHTTASLLRWLPTSISKNYHLVFPNTSLGLLIWCTARGQARAWPTYNTQLQGFGRMVSKDSVTSDLCHWSARFLRVMELMGFAYQYLPLGISGKICHDSEGFCLSKRFGRKKIASIRPKLEMKPCRGDR